MPESEVFRKYKMPYSIPEFPLELTSAEAYRTMVENAFIILDDRKKRLEQLLEMEMLPKDAEEEVRSARGKIMVLSQKNLTKFQKLIESASNDKQGIDDLTGFWNIVVVEMNDLKRACDIVEQLHKNNWQPLPVSDEAAKPSPRHTSRIPRTPASTAKQPPRRKSEGTPALREFLASKRGNRNTPKQKEPTTVHFA